MNVWITYCAVKHWHNLVNILNLFLQKISEPQKIVDLMCNCENYRKICEASRMEKCINEVVQIMTKGSENNGRTI